eukprot:GDKJ01058553.1.p1 GENE.GDKJ01058553.1~~GDKJ01058553.1.p1  ORF type:complete len:253 (+),score=0.23 GDKJ01058553.1:170-928(+)
MAQIQRDVVAGNALQQHSNSSGVGGGKSKGGQPSAKALAASAEVLRPIINIYKAMGGTLTNSFASGKPHGSVLHNLSSGIATTATNSKKAPESLAPLRRPNTSPSPSRAAQQQSSQAAVSEYLQLRRDGTDPRSQTQITPNGVVLVRTRPRVQCRAAGRVISIDPAGYAPSNVPQSTANSASMAADLRNTTSAFKGKSRSPTDASRSSKVGDLRRAVAQQNTSAVESPTGAKVAGSQNIPPSDRRVLYDVPL